MSLPYFQLYPTDYEADTAHLTILEDGAYLRLLRLCWTTPGCSVPDDEQWIMRRMRARTDEEKDAVRTVIDEFFQRAKGRVFNPRLLAEYESASDKHKKAVENGKKGGRPAKPLKSNGSTKSKRKPDGKAKQKLKKANQNQNQNHNTTPISPKGDADLFGETSKPEKPIDPVDILAAVVPRETAQDFAEHRAALKKKLTVLAAERIVKKLMTFPDPVASIDASIEHGWSGVFERTATEQSRPRNEAQKRDDRISRWRDRIERKYGTG